MSNFAMAQGQSWERFFHMHKSQDCPHGEIAFSTKGQLISECLFEKIVWTKIPTKNLIDSAQQV